MIVVRDRQDQRLELKEAIRETCVVISLDEVPAGSGGDWTVPEALASSHEKRRREWLAGRRALRLAFETLGLSIDPATVVFDGHQKIAALPDYRFSISHTAAGAGCWLIHDPSDQLRIGFDLELKSRELSPALTQRFAQPADRIQGLRAWCAKEAVYKCLSASTQKGLALATIALGATEFHIEGTALSGTYEVLEDRPDFIFAFASRKA